MLNYDIKSFDVPVQFRINKLFTMINSTIQPGASFVGESHDFWECSYIKKGSVCSCVDDKVYNIESGDLIFYKPMEFHHYHLNSDGGAENFFFSFSFENYPKDFAQDTVYKLNSHQKEILHKLIELNDNAVKNTLFTEEEIAMQKSEYINYKYVRSLLAFNKNPIDMSNMLNYIYELFHSLYGSKNIVKEASSYHAEIYRSAVSFMTEHISEKITVSDIAKHCHVSETSLKQVFSRFTNTSIHKHFIHLKITQAIMLLKSGVSASETARRIGFVDQSYFSVAFKRETGRTPRDYLKKV